MANLTVAKFSVVGVGPTFVAAAAGGDTFYNNGQTYLVVKNSSGASINVTVDSKKQCSHGFDHDLVTAVAAGATKQIGPFPTDRYNDDNGYASVSYSAVTTVTVVPLDLIG